MVQWQSQEWHARYSWRTQDQWYCNEGSHVPRPSAAPHIQKAKEESLGCLSKAASPANQYQGEPAHGAPDELERAIKTIVNAMRSA